MKTVVNMKSDLSAAGVQLLEIIDSLGFGVIEELVIRDGEPCFHPAPRVLKDIKIGYLETGAREGVRDRDFALKNGVIQLFEHLSPLRSARVTIEVKHSLPFRIVVESVPEGEQMTAGPLPKSKRERGGAE